MEKEGPQHVVLGVKGREWGVFPSCYIGFTFLASSPRRSASAVIDDEFKAPYSLACGANEVPGNLSCRLVDAFDKKPGAVEMGKCLF